MDLSCFCSVLCLLCLCARLFISALGSPAGKGRVRLLTGMDRNGQEWTSITGMDLKIHPKIHVLSVLDKKFWLSNVKYQISLVSRQFQCKKDFLKYFLPYPHILVPYYLRLTYTSHL